MPGGALDEGGAFGVRVSPERTIEPWRVQFPALNSAKVVGGGADKAFLFVGSACATTITKWTVPRLELEEVKC
jgi:hypothetical protein